MTFWEFVLIFWNDNGWNLIFLSVFLVFLYKLYDAIKVYFLVRKVPNKDKQEEMMKSFNELTQANTHARNEIGKLHKGLSETKTLLDDLNDDISNLHEKINTSKKMLKDKKKKKVIEKNDLQEVIDVLER